MYIRIILLLMLTCHVPTQIAGQVRQRRVNPPVEQAAVPARPSAGNNLYVVDAEAGDTLRKIAAREQVSLAELERVNGIDPDTELEEGQEIHFYSSGPHKPSKVFTFRTKYEDDTLAKIAARLRIPVEDLLQHNSFGPDEPLSAGELLRIPFTQSYIDRKKRELSSRSARGARADHQQKRRSARAGRPASGVARRSAGRGGSSSDDYYTNVDGARVRRPVHSRRAPAGASAQCRDGSYSFSRHRRGTCSHHGGVARWL